ncbi:MULTISPECIES: hypothetical protein [Archaeoglobus]|jgi:hypothetical protein|uniref:Uncharacterized protein AF_2147 n=2 Tax=Archaeoglobus fulgidus TaxID=2234 RepID=Y2147_ARCFU|nr:MULTISPECIES: hypothetical protein [Archaeoglobus]O28135.1 RecName: Full=Uncharacterized protein AF_2147 [Archaeoglobus fulgidus DSM 4304]AAB89117.1 predicted coding region AF_2147 [Archaeoglobus fulgidus DSM 4304]AIG99134.1 hypothetical protein AFULGI_00024170 [Archaeoglobus fulgidus DSM 8774]MDI3498827.1 hypothetical protein [Archaeoglobus sp.]
MEIIQNVFNRAENGDRIMISFPDMLSFFTVTKWLNEQFGNPLWILWTDAAVERLNHLGKKLGYPVSGNAVTIGAIKECLFLDVVARYDFYDDVSSLLKSLPVGNVLLISFGVNFLEIFGQGLSKAIEFIIEHENGILCTCTVGEAPDILLPFHDTFIEIKSGEESYLTYKSYVAKLRFSVDGGTIEMSDSFLVSE